MKLVCLSWCIELSGPAAPTPPPVPATVPASGGVAPPPPPAGMELGTIQNCLDLPSDKFAFLLNPPTQVPKKIVLFVGSGQRSLIWSDSDASEVLNGLFQDLDIRSAINT